MCMIFYPFTTILKHFRKKSVCVCVYVVYIYIYIYISRKRERENLSERITKKCGEMFMFWVIWVKVNNSPCDPGPDP